MMVFVERGVGCGVVGLFQGCWDCCVVMSVYVAKIQGDRVR